MLINHFNNLDEFVYHVTHDRTIDWLLPGVPATGKALSIPMMAVVNIRGDRLYNGKLKKYPDYICLSLHRKYPQSIFGGIKLQLYGRPVFSRFIFRFLTPKRVSHHLCVCPLSAWKARTCSLMNQKGKVTRCCSRGGRRYEAVFWREERYMECMVGSYAVSYMIHHLLFCAASETKSGDAITSRFKANYSIEPSVALDA